MTEHSRPPGPEGRRTNSPRDARTKTSAGISRKRRSNAVKIKPPPPTTQRGRETRRRLMAALTVLLQERAFHEIRLEDITHERSEEHTTELQSLMRISYAVFCLTKT